MAVFYFLFSIILILMWWLCRRVLEASIVKPLLLNKKLLFVYDLIFIVGTGINIGTRVRYFSHSTMVTYALRFYYVLLGFMGLLVAGYILVRVLERVSRSKLPHDESRRSFLKRNIALGGVGSAVAATTVGAIQAMSPELEKVTIKLKDKHKGLNGLKIVQLSDIHIGPTLKKDFFDELVRRTNELKPDIVVITGDMVDGIVSDLAPELINIDKFESTLGTYYVTGNHEYYWGGEDWINFVKSKGIKVFENDHTILNFKGTNFVLGGVYDLKAFRFVKEHSCRPIDAFKNSPDHMYKIMLAHQPMSYLTTDGLGLNLQLSGHTHGGQGFPWNIIVSFVQPYLKGLYDHKGMDLYVSQEDDKPEIHLLFAK
ncbi:MAG: metallophosphoesterase [Bacteriovoracaceae bacterium]|nr:metallophosphoesterase [Bacteriovoracaceae bacterium]